MRRQELIQRIYDKKSFLCIGLDTDVQRIPTHLLSSPQPVLEFNRQIIQATHQLCVAYKINTAFYEALGATGWEILNETIRLIPEGIFVIADAKRGDIGNTSKMYASAFFEKMQCDAITLSPYMGEDSVKPFLNFKDKWSILLALTSNMGSADFQQLLTNKGEKVYEVLLRKASTWGSADNMMFVVGATHPQEFLKIRSIVPEHFLLVPGVGAQGGSLEQVCQFGMNADVGLIINSSRSIIYAGEGRDFAQKAAHVAESIQQQMSQLLKS